MVEFGIKEIYLLAAILLLFRFTTRKVSSMLLMYGIFFSSPSQQETTIANDTSGTSLCRAKKASKTIFDAIFQQVVYSISTFNRA